MPDLNPQTPNGEILLFQSADGTTRVECRVESDTLWLTQALIADLYQKGVPTINEHLSNIFSEGEVDRNSTIRKFRIVRQEGTRQVAREIEHYNLEAILAVGYRVRSPQGYPWPTAAELIHLRADAQKPSVGLTHFTGDEPRKADMTVAKNYLSEKELSQLNRLVTASLEFAELQAERGRLMKMADWRTKPDDFLRLSDYELLNHAGSISAVQAKQKVALMINIGSTM